MTNVEATIQALKGHIKALQEHIEAFKETIENQDKVIKALEQEPKVGRCEDCKHFHKLPYHVDTLGNTLGKCFQHTGFYPKGDWFCADFEPQESEENNG